MQKKVSKFITFEGGDGVGKSTLISKVISWINEQDISYISTREPGGTDVAEEIRDTILKTGRSVSPIAELLLYEAARADHVEKLIKPALASGKTVICDRFTHSSLAFQGYARGLGASLVTNLNSIATGGLNPDAVVWLKLDPTIAKKRMESRGEMTRLDLEKEAFHQAVFDAFSKISADEKERFIVLDAAKSPDEIFANLLTNKLWIKLFSK